MDRALNKSTNQIVSACEVFHNGSYQNLDKGEWIAPKDSIINFEECEESDLLVHYVKEHDIKLISGKIITRAPHFAVYPGSKAKTIAESETHKMLKNWIFNRLKNDDLEIRYSKGIKPHKYDNKIKLSELNPNWNDYEIEVTTKGTKRLRADILLPFNKRDILLGNGIIFEIQLSSQSEAQTYERTIERALHGYSISWLFENDFIIEEENIFLKENIVNVNSFSEQMHFAKKGFVKKLKYIVEEQCRFLDEKIRETNFTIQKLEDKKESIGNEILKRLSTREAVLINKIESIENNPFEGLINEYKERLNKEFLIKQESLTNQFQILQKKLNYPLTFGECNQCHQGFMVYKITKTGKEVYGCSNYPNGCKNTIWLN